MNQTVSGSVKGPLEGSVVVPRVPRFPLLAPLRSGNFALLWGGNAISLAGDQLQAVALAVLALEVTGSAAVLGTVLAVQAIPRVLLMLIGGVVADRFRPRGVMLTANALQGTLVAMLATVLWLERLETWHLYAYAAASGMAYAFSIPASNALLPQLVSREQLRSGNALNSLNFNLASFLFPPLAGLLVVRLGYLPAFVLNAVSFFVAVVALASIRPRESTRAPVTGSALHQLAEGVRAARRDRVVWLAIWAAAIFSLGFSGASFVGVPALATLTFDAGAEGVGLAYGATGAGAVVGAIAMGSLTSLRRQGLAAGVVLLALGVFTSLVALAPTLAVALPLLVVAGLCRAGCANVYLTLVQTRAPAEVRGRVMALFMMGVMGLSPLSLGLGGLLGEALGPRALIGAGGLIITLGGLYALSQREFRAAD